MLALRQHAVRERLAGLVEQGQTAFVKITLTKGEDNYKGSEHNGVQSRGYGPWELSYQLEALPTAAATSGADNTVDIPGFDR